MSSSEDKQGWHAWAGNFPAEQCLLRALTEESAKTRAALISASLADLRRLLNAGFTLRSGWPRPWSHRVERRLGRRLYLTHAANVSAGVGLASVASSALGRSRRQLAEWPALLDSALQRIQLHDQTLLVVPGTTVYDAALAFAQRAGLACLDACVDRVKPSTSISTWLERWLMVPPDQLRGKLLISAELERPGDNSSSVNSSSVNSSYAESSEKLPLQDRLAVLLSDVVMAMHVRAGGTIDRLLQERLAAPEYPLGTTYCAVKPPGSSTAGGTKPPLELMDRGAIGWYVMHRRQPLHHQPLLACHQSRPALVQLTACSGAWGQQLSREDTVSGENAVRWLTHCTRGTSDAGPGESEAQFRDRLWLKGEQTSFPPLHILSTILAEQVLKGSSQLYRGGHSCVSFTAIPLAELLRQRVYRSHLGRWDWEPYGLMIRREALEQIGCRPAIYGSEQDYRTLDDSDKPYFQPGKSHNDWSLEREWRLVGDLHLSALPVGSWFAFTRTRREALQLARCAPCPIGWSVE